MKKFMILLLVSSFQVLAVNITAKINWSDSTNFIISAGDVVIFKNISKNQLKVLPPQNLWRISNEHFWVCEDTNSGTDWSIWPAFTGCTFAPSTQNLGGVYFNITVTFVATDIQPPQVNVIQPLSDRHINNIDSIIISCTDNSHLLNSFIYHISYDNGITWELIRRRDEQLTDELFATFPKYQEYTPNTLSTACIIRVITIDPTGNADTGFSPTFACYDTIVPEISLTQPPEQNAGCTYQISWNASDNISLKTWSVYIAKNGTSFIKHDSASNTATSCSWAIPDDHLTSSCKVRVNVFDQSGNTASATSEAFIIKDTIVPTVVITAPATGSSWNIGSTNNIAWAYSDNSDAFKARAVYINRSGADSLLDSSTSNTGTFSWKATGIVSNITIKINVYDPSGNKNTSSCTVSLADSNSPIISLTEPVENSRKYAGGDLRVRWDASDNGILAGVVFYLSIDDGNTFFYMDSVEGNPGVRTFALPDTIYSNTVTRVQCKIYDSEGNMASTVSGPFTVKNIFLVSGKVSLDSPVVYLGETDTVRMSFKDNTRIIVYAVKLSTDSGKTFPIQFFAQTCSLEPKTVHNKTWAWLVGDKGKGVESHKCFLRFYSWDQQVPAACDSLTSKLFKIAKRPETRIIKNLTLKQKEMNYIHFGFNGQRQQIGSNVVLIKKTSDNRIKKFIQIKHY